MAFQPHSVECRKRFEEILREEAKVKSQKARMEEFEERMKLKSEKAKDKREEVIGKKDKVREVIAEESRDSGG
eukprot:1000756-Karenia_brevis.AAC.1